MSECLVGKKFNKLTIVEELANGQCKCICECGNEKIARKNNVKGNLTISCGCAKRKSNLIGKIFTYLTVTGYLKGSGYLCNCICGEVVVVSGYNLERGNKKSCGCMANFRELLVGQTFNELTVISQSEQKITCKSKQRFWNCKCSCGKELVVSTEKLKVQLSCGHKNINKVHDGLSAKYKHIYKKWHCFKKDNRLSQEFLEFKDFLDHILINLGDRKNKYGYLMPMDDSELISPANIIWKYLQHIQNFCDIEYKWCSNCERYVQNGDKFWTKKKSCFCRKCIQVYGLKIKYNLEYKDYLLLLNKCNRQCQICSSKDRLVVDHCHKSNQIRGILCSNCNSGLGQFNDNVDYINKAIEYLSSGLTEEIYGRNKRDFSNKICPITNSSNLVVDHCHKTNLVRGDIDFNVNIGIGLFKDNINNLNKAIVYLGRSLCHL